MRMGRRVLWASVVSISLSFPSTGFAGDLSAALNFVQNKSYGNLVRDYKEQTKAKHVSLMGLLEARNVPEGKALEDYDCIEDGKLDRFWSPKYGKSEQRLIVRYCVDAQFDRGQIRGYQSLGNNRLRLRQIEGDIQRAADAAGISKVLVREIIALSSGYYPGAISDEGRVGLMQLLPNIAEEFGADNVFDPVQNIRAGASYLAHLIEKWDSIPLALAEYRGASERELSNRQVPTRRSLIWWVRAINKQNEVETADFPVELGWENIALVATWLN